MKKTIVITASMLFLSIFTLRSQDKKNQIGLNVTGFVKQYLVLNSQNISGESPYLLTYRRLGNKFNVRAGMFASSSYTRKDEFGGVQLVYNNTKNFGIRLGVDRTMHLTKKWNLYYGMDVFTNQSSFDQHTIPKNPGPFVSETKFKSSTKSIGLSPNITIEYNINPRISFYTETSFNVSWSHASESSDSPNFPGSSMSSWTNFGSANFSLPISIFCAFRF